MAAVPLKDAKRTPMRSPKRTQDKAPVSRKIQLFEVGAFLFLVLPSLVLSLFITGEGDEGFRLTAVLVIVRDLALVSLVLYFVWRNGEGFGQLGWTLRRLPLEVLLGILLFVPMTFGINWLEQFLTGIGLSSPPKSSSGFLQPTGHAQSSLWLAVGLVIVVAIAEETIFRGYLLLRFMGIGLGKVLAVVLSSAIFALGHGYEGMVGVATVGVMGVFFALIYLWRGSLIAPMVMHFLQDFIAIVLLPFLVGS
ncbi:MAG: CPBP family intramembrane metalloprotease [Thiohalocapsa sp.]|jgi:membrane protease YdiL (CAAX protease family)|uniref:CPBP family intramembrane glutamic endopeptidase n=1 Tax=Thiohalocapsa sp. TaxID=2497641 RepID=UPI0025E24A27|nr:CPBP family intramembrane glutamic endopeptidase [Thiohalocapsa sp.]MCG6940900.1 CPBP family intramembrane metalloprotease [Thiohalocapsa sp.]